MENWICAHSEECIALLKTLGKIPAPSHHEEKRAEFVLDWFHKQGGKAPILMKPKTSSCLSA